MQVFGIMLVTVLITAGITLWLAKTYIFPSQFEPVVLTSQENQLLSEKLSMFDFSQNTTATPAPAGTTSVQNQKKPAEDENPNGPLQPEAYSEKGASREISFTERELNAMLAKNTDLATKVAIDLADNLISARLRIPVDEDFPIFAGKTLRAAAGVELAFRGEKPVVILKGVKLMGVPIPNAWLGGLKNIDLIQEFGGEEGFWKLFSDGVESIETKEGELNIILKE
ncbi:MAG TPA: arginine N-succinyltransferase [Desulfobacterales bacterium]|nr:arginine N-succinyltransferase [Desulfobacterales bacterium]HIP38706.1 arginine N-succinyltransferase [Desulfocapsa sulfexigens]